MKPTLVILLAFSFSHLFAQKTRWIEVHQTSWRTDSTYCFSVKDILHQRKNILSSNIYTLINKPSKIRRIERLTKAAKKNIIIDTVCRDLRAVILFHSVHHSYQLHINKNGWVFESDSATYPLTQPLAKCLGLRIPLYKKTPLKIRLSKLYRSVFGRLYSDCPRTKEEWW